MERRITLETLAHRSDAGRLYLVVEARKDLLGRREILLAGDSETALDVEHQGPDPDRAVAAGQILRPLVVGIRRLVEGIARRERTQAATREQVLAHNAQNIHYLLLAEHRIVQTTRHDHVRAAEIVHFAVVYIVGKIVLPEPELRQERGFRTLGHVGPAVDKLLILHFGGQRQRIAYGIVPQGLDLDIISRALRYGVSVDLGIHPRQGLAVGRSPDQAVVMQHDTPAETAAVCLQHGLHGLAVTCPQLLGADMFLQILQRPEEPQRSIRGNPCRSRAREIAVMHAPHHRVENIHAILLVTLLQYHARQRDEGIASHRAVPRISGNHLRTAARTAYDELTCRVVQTTQEVDLVRAARKRRLIYLGYGLARGHLVRGGREDHALALLDVHLEVTRRQQILVAVIAALDLLGVFEIVVPVGCGYKLRIRLVGLQIEPRETLVETALDSARDGIRTAVGIHVCLRERMLVAEGEEGTQAQRGIRMGVDQRIAYHELRALVYPQQLLAQDHTPDTVGDRRRRRIFEIRDILVTARFVYALVTVQSQIERLVVLDDRLVQRRKQYVGFITVVDRRHHQSVVLAGIAAHDRRAHITALTVRSEHLALKRILQIAQLALVKCKCRHISILEKLSFLLKVNKIFRMRGTFSAFFYPVSLPVQNVPPIGSVRPAYLYKPLSTCGQ